VTSGDLVEQLLAGLDVAADRSEERIALLRTMLTRVVELAAVDHDERDLRVAATVLDELLEAATVFSPWEDRRKLTVFGSARAKPGSPLYEMARDLSRVMAERDWITVSGAGPGIMEASAMGAGRDNTLGVNIDLPYEQSSNAYIDADTRLVEMKYFFTRKVALTRESLAFAIFPGGLGTMDETFEILTLLNTGKTNPAPVVLVDTPTGDYWERWLDFIEQAVVAHGYLDPPELCLFRVVHDVGAAVEEIERFYSNFVSFTHANGRARLTLRRAPTPENIVALADRFTSFASGAGFVLEARTLTFAFDGRSFVTLRQLIDVVNDLPDA
jgi:uncharacterized protein (TIGR00730 family)